MGDLEEALRRNYYLIDSRDARYQHILMIIISSLIFLFYGVFLWILCSLSLNVLVIVLLIGTQVGLGLPLTRTYYSFGISTHKTLKLQDAGLHAIKGAIYDLRINSDELPLLFERLEIQVRKYDAGKLDDLSDISWFIVITWAIVASIYHYVSSSSSVLCVLGVFVLASACFLSYASGYWTKIDRSFEDDVNQLEYYISAFIKCLDSQFSNANSKLVLRLTDRGHSSVIVDIAVELVMEGVATIEYHFGLSSNLQERFVIEAPSDIIYASYEILINQKAISDAGWSVERITTQSGVIIRVVNMTKYLNFSDRASYILSPSAIDKLSKETGDIFSTVVSAIAGSK